MILAQVMAGSWSQGFGKRLKKALADKDRRQKDLAAYLGDTEGAVSRWISGSASPPLEKFARICRYLGSTPASLLGLSHDDPPPPAAEHVPIDLQRDIERLQEAERRRRDEIDAHFQALTVRVRPKR